MQQSLGQSNSVVLGFMCALVSTYCSRPDGFVDLRCTDATPTEVVRCDTKFYVHPNGQLSV